MLFILYYLAEMSQLGWRTGYSLSLEDYSYPSHVLLQCFEQSSMSHNLNSDVGIREAHSCYFFINSFRDNVGVLRC